DPALVPVAWQSAPIVHPAPLAEEFGSEMVRVFEKCQLLGITPQGFLRSWNADGFVRRSPWNDPEEVLRASDAVVLSEEDVEGDWDILRYYADVARLLVVTQGARGCIVFHRG